MLHLPPAIVTRLQAYKVKIVILAPETADSVSVWPVVHSDGGMDVAHYYADVIYLLPSLGITKGAWGLWYSE